MIALIDGDIVTYRVGFVTEGDDEHIASYRTDDVIERILRDVGASEYRVYLTKEKDPDAFRYKVYPEYKAHRKAPKPRHYHHIREHLRNVWHATDVSVIEADDQLAIDQISLGSNSVICSIDKDLLQIAGNHYNFVKEQWCEVTFEEGLRHFYSQLLIGDPADNIKGVYRIGKQKAAAILKPDFCEQEMFDAVREKYSCDEEMVMNGRVLWIWRTKNDDWQQHFDVLIQEPNLKDFEIGTPSSSA